MPAFWFADNPETRAVNGRLRVFAVAHDHRMSSACDRSTIGTTCRRPCHHHPYHHPSGEEEVAVAAARPAEAEAAEVVAQPLDTNR